MKEIWLKAILKSDGKTEIKFKAFRWKRHKGDYGTGHYFTIGSENNYKDGGEHLIDGRYNGKTASDFESVCIEFIKENYRVIPETVTVI